MMLVPTNRMDGGEPSKAAQSLQAVPESPVISEHLTAKITFLIGCVFYAVGDLSFIGIFFSYFILHFWSASAESRLALVGMLFGMFCSFQGLVFIMISKMGEARHQQTDLLLEQMRIRNNGG